MSNDFHTVYILCRVAETSAHTVSVLFQRNTVDNGMLILVKEYSWDVLNTRLV